jgi:uncharacterized protein (TIGR03435 family)
MKLYTANKVSLGWTLFRTTAGIAAAELPLAIGMLTAPRTDAQSPVQRPEFEVASIKPNVELGPRVFIGERSPGTFSAENVTLQNLIQEAYGSASEHWLPYRKAPQQGLPILGGPGWAGSDRFDITAKSTGPRRRTSGVTKEAQVQMDLMLRALLEDRFRLKLHRETKDLPVFAMTVAKGGLKLGHQSCVTFNPDSLPTIVPGQKPPNYCGSARIGRTGADWTLDGAAMSMNDLAGTLSLLIGSRPVIDRTGFTGLFDVHMQWTPGPGQPGDADKPASSDDVGGQSVFTVLHRQLGLELKTDMGPVEILVIDHVEKPSVN